MRPPPGVGVRGRSPSRTPHAFLPGPGRSARGIRRGFSPSYPPRGRQASILVGGRRRVKEPNRCARKPRGKRLLSPPRAFWNCAAAAYNQMPYGRTHAADRDGQGSGLSGQVESKYFGLGARQVAETIRPERAGRLRHRRRRGSVSTFARAGAGPDRGFLHAHRGRPVHLRPDRRGQLSQRCVRDGRPADFRALHCGISEHRPRCRDSREDSPGRPCQDAGSRLHGDWRATRLATTKSNSATR